MVRFLEKALSSYCLVSLFSSTLGILVAGPGSGDAELASDTDRLILCERYMYPQNATLLVRPGFPQSISRSIGAIKFTVS